MPVKIRLQRKGRKKRPFYHIVVADARAPRDGRFIEKLGFYNPMTVPATIEIDRDKAYEWLNQGAQPTETARSILRFKGVLYKKHLMRGVKKGAFSEEKAEEMYNDFINAKDARIAKRFEEEAEKMRAYHAKISGVAPPPRKIEEIVVEDVPGGEEAATEVADTAEAAVEEVKAEATEAAAEVKEEVVEAAAEAKEEVAEAAAEVKEEVKEAAAEVKEEVAEAAKEATEEAKDGDA